MADLLQHFLRDIIGDAAAGRSDNMGIICACRGDVNPANAMAALAEIIPSGYSNLIPIDIERERTGERWCWSIIYYVNDVTYGTHLQDEDGNGPRQCKDGNIFYKEASCINPTGCLLQGETRGSTSLPMVNRTGLKKINEPTYNGLPPARRFRTTNAFFERLPEERRQYPKAHHYTVCGHCKATRMKRTRSQRRSRKRGSVS